jgi:GAF domain-containing protein
MHGELKRLLVEAEEQLILAQEEEDRTEEAMDSMERKYWEGQCDAISYLYTLTYGLYFAISERDGK